MYRRLGDILAAATHLGLVVTMLSRSGCIHLFFLKVDRRRISQLFSFALIPFNCFLPVLRRMQQLFIGPFLDAANCELASLSLDGFGVQKVGKLLAYLATIKFFFFFNLLAICFDIWLACVWQRYAGVRAEGKGVRIEWNLANREAGR